MLPLRSFERPLGRLTLLESLARSPRGVVWRVEDARGQPYALKQTPLGREDASAAGIPWPRHDAFVPRLDAWQAGGFRWQLMPLYEGDARRLPPGAGQAAAWGAHLAAGLAALHALGWAHRDLKPENLLVAAGRPAIADLDHAAPIGQRGAPTSPLYAAPQALLNEPTAPADDVYALGVLLAEWLCGAHPWAHLPATHALIRRFEGEVPRLPPAHAAWQPLLAALLQREAAARPTMRTVAQRLAALD